MQILKETRIAWRADQNTAVDQRVEVRLDHGDTKSMKAGRRVRQGCYFSPILFNSYSEYITNEVVEESRET
jgi:hypothetical protein